MWAPRTLWLLCSCYVPVCSHASILQCSTCTVQFTVHVAVSLDK